MPDIDDESSGINPEDRRALYAARGFLPASVERRLGVKLHFDTYFEDPGVAEQSEALGLNPEFFALWEPGLDDGPTSARFAVVDYDADLGKLAKPIIWKWNVSQFVDAEGNVVDWSRRQYPEFRQLNVWAVLQNALEFYEGGFGLGRSIPWGFDGNRLIVVPNAGYAKNAYYDRESKSLQFYYFDNPKMPGERIYTSLSADIIRHEFGHAILDGIRPHFIEAISPETAGFHEFIGDLTAILIAFRNNAFRNKVAEDTGGDLSTDNILASIAQQFGEANSDKPYLRTGLNTKKMNDVAGSVEPHFISQVLTGAMFDLIRKLVDHYRNDRGEKLKRAFWNTIQRMQRMAIQPLDLLPPVDVTFVDYARAMLRAEELTNPVDPHDMRSRMFDVFCDRGILSVDERDTLLAKKQVYDRPDLTIFHDMKTVARSKAEAYRFLNDNRPDFLIPHDRDFSVSDLYTCRKLGRQGVRQPEQICILYVWRETVLLAGARFGRFDGQRTSMLCGGTLVFDENGLLLSWARKPGTGAVRTKKGAMTEMADADREIGEARLVRFLNDLAQRIAHGNIGRLPVSQLGFIGARMPPLVAREAPEGFRFELTPHLGIETDQDEISGGRKWEISS